MAEEDNSPLVENNDVVDEGGDQEDISQPTPLWSVDDGNEAEPKPRIRSPKEDEVLDACRRRDFEELQSLAESPGGFVTDELRQQAWPILLGLPLRIRSEEDEKTPDTDLDSEDLAWKDLPRHKDEDQVRLDVERAFVYYPHYQSDRELDQQKTALSNIILSVLRRYPYLHYFQGYHDIAQVFLLVLPPALRGPAVARLSILRIRDFMLPDLSAAVAQLRLIPAILHAADPPLWAHLSQTEPFFALSGTLTMYAHDVRSLGEIARLFDVLLAREPVFSVYLFARIVLDRRAELFGTPPTEPEMLHSILSKLPQPLDLEALVAGAARLLAAYPPERLPAEWCGRGGPRAAWTRGIGEHSVLKTARSARACAGQSEAVGAYYFAQQVLELERAERRERMLRVMWKYRRPAATVGFAVLFGVLAYWMRRSAFLSAVLSNGGGPRGGSGGLLAGPLRYVTAAFSKWWYREL